MRLSVDVVELSQEGLLGGCPILVPWRLQCGDEGNQTIEEEGSRFHISEPVPTWCEVL